MEKKEKKKENEKIYYGPYKLRKGYERPTQEQSVLNNQVRWYGINELDEKYKGAKLEKVNEKMLIEEEKKVRLLSSGIRLYISKLKSTTLSDEKKKEYSEKLRETYKDLQESQKKVEEYKAKGLSNEPYKITYPDQIVKKRGRPKIPIEQRKPREKKPRAKRPKKPTAAEVSKRKTLEEEERKAKEEIEKAEKAKIKAEKELKKIPKAPPLPPPRAPPLPKQKPKIPKAPPLPKLPPKAPELPRPIIKKQSPRKAKTYRVTKKGEIQKIPNRYSGIPKAPPLPKPKIPVAPPPPLTKYHEEALKKYKASVTNFNKTKNKQKNKNIKLPVTRKVYDLD